MDHLRKRVLMSTSYGLLSNDLPSNVHEENISPLDFQSFNICCLTPFSILAANPSSNSSILFNKVRTFASVYSGFYTPLSLISSIT